MSELDHHHAARMTRLVDKLESVLHERGVLDREDLAEMTERFLASAGPANGARLVARAWTDPSFRDLLLDDATMAIEELGFSMRRGMQPDLRLRVVANDEHVHNLLVCTLCSCYPIALLGPPPGWYRSPAFRARAVSEPRTVLREFGLDLPATVEVRVWDSTSDLRYMVLPRRPEGTNELSEAQLAALVPRDALVGAATALSPSSPSSS